MLALILLIIFGLGVAFFATQNAGLTHIVLGGYMIGGVPLYLIVVGSMLLGIFVSWLISVVDGFFSTLTLHWKTVHMEKVQQTIDELKAQNHSLEVENTHLKEEIGNIPEKVEGKEQTVSDYSPHIKHSLSF